jgi:histidinol-phosphatase (PHP family)
MLADYHIHTVLCKHADGTIDEYVDAALKKRIDEIGFSDHCPYPAGFDTRFRMEPSEFETYKKLVFAARAKFAKPAIKFGLEVDWVPGQMDDVFSRLEKEPFDYFIGSTHYIKGFPFDNPEAQNEWRKKKIADEVWTQYMSLMFDMVSSGRFDIIGHFDLPKKFGYYPSSMEKINNVIEKILEVAAQNQTAIEINTSGLRKPVKEIYPSLHILKLARKKGVPICFGSDAHNPSEVGFNFDNAISLAKEAGYRRFCLFKERKAIEVPI